MLEKSVEEHLVQRVKEEGGEIRKVKWVGRRGAPDRYVMLPGAAAWVELKRPGKTVADPHQAREFERMERLGVRVYLLSTKAAVDVFIARLKGEGIANAQSGNNRSTRQDIRSRAGGSAG